LMGDADLERQGSDRVAKRNMFNQLARAISQKLDIGQRNSSNEAEPTYCAICYTNEIIPSPDPIGEDTVTIEFSCFHRFCKDCARENLRIKIASHEVDKMVCP